MTEVESERVLGILEKSVGRDEKRGWWNSSFFCTVVGGILIALITWGAQTFSDQQRRKQDHIQDIAKREQDRASSIYDRRLQLMGAFSESFFRGSESLRAAHDFERGMRFAQARARVVEPNSRDFKELRHLEELDDADMDKYLGIYNEACPKFESCASQATTLFPNVSSRIEGLLTKWRAFDRYAFPAAEIRDVKGLSRDVALAQLKEDNRQIEEKELAQGDAIRNEGELIIQEMGSQVSALNPSLETQLRKSSEGDGVVGQVLGFWKYLLLGAASLVVIVLFRRRGTAA